MRISMPATTMAVLMLGVLVIGCNGGTYSNPSSPSAATTEWRTVTVDEFGGTYNFPDIGMFVYIPPEAVQPGESYTYQVRRFPPGIPLLPSGPVLVRLGTFQFFGVDASFDRDIEVRFMIAEEKPPGINSRGYRLNDDLEWEFNQNAPILSDGWNAVMYIDRPGIYGAFEYVPLHVEATVSRQSGPVPLSVAFKAIVTGGHPPYSIVWDFGDAEDPEAGVAVSHIYPEPGDYNVTVMVMDQDNIWTSDWIHLTAYWIAGPPALP